MVYILVACQQFWGKKEAFVLNICAYVVSRKHITITRLTLKQNKSHLYANSLLALIASMSSVFTLASCRWPSIVSRNLSCAILRSGFLGRPSSSRFSNGIFNSKSRKHTQTEYALCADRVHYSPLPASRRWLRKTLDNVASAGASVSECAQKRAAHNLTNEPSSHLLPPAGHWISCRAPVCHSATVGKEEGKARCLKNQVAKNVKKGN